MLGWAISGAHQRNITGAEVPISRLSRLTFRAVTVFAIISACSLPAAGTDFPSKQITLVVATGPGGVADSLARIVARYMEGEWGKNVIVLNKPGAGGALGLAAVKNEVPDGHTLVVANGGAFASQWQIMESPTYKVDDFTYVNSLASSACAWVTSAQSPYITLKDVWTAAKSGKSVSFGAYSIETKMYMDYVARKEGAEITGVIFSSVPEALQAVLGRHVDFGFSGGSHAQNVKDGTMRVLAATGDARTGDSPDVLTLKEMGYGVSNCAIHAMAGPKGIPEDVVNKLANGIGKAMQTEAALKFLKGQNDLGLNDGPAGLADRMKTEAAAFAEIKNVLKRTF